MTLQRTFAYHQQIGQVGAIARPSAPYDVDQGQAEVELKPGQGVFYNPATNKWKLPTSDAERLLVTHVVTFYPNSFNSDIGAPTTNNITEVVFAADAIVPLVAFGSVFVTAGETLETEDAVIYNQTTEKWIKYNPASATPNDLRKKVFTAYLNPGETVADGGIFEIKVATPNYSFPSIGDLEANTVKVSMTATEIKQLRASPKELVAAQGADTLIQLVNLQLVLNAGSEVLTETDDNLAVEYDDGSAVAVSGTIEATGFIDQAADTMTNAILAGDTIDALADVVNKNLVLINTGDGEYAGNASDDATLDAYVTYRVLSLA